MCWYIRTQSGKFRWFNDCGSQKFSVKDVNLETIIDTLLWCKTWQHSGYNQTQVKQFFQETQKSFQKFLELTRKTKVIYTDNS